MIFDTDVSGQVIRRRESDNNTSQGDPSSVWYRFAGRQMGMVTNNGGWEGSYAASVTQRQTAPLSSAPGAFANGATVGKQEAQFSSNLEVINSYSQGSVAGTYVVRSGDSLQGIAQNLWGDSGLWYKLAQANGLSGNAALFEGQSLRLPAGVIRNTYNASTITPYNPAETLGDVTPSTPQAAPPKKQKCGALGQILLVVIAVAVTFAAPFGGGIIGGALNAAAGSVVSQVVGVATGIQEKFDWKGVALAAISGGVGGAVGAAVGGGNFVVLAAVKGAATSAISQGIGVALGLQDRFSWAAVAAAGVGAGVGQAVGNRIDVKPLAGDGSSRTWSNFGKNLVVSGANAIANAATRSLIEGTDFGDNIRASLLDVVGGVVGAALGGAVIGRSKGNENQITKKPTLPEENDQPVNSNTSETSGEKFEPNSDVVVTADTLNRYYLPDYLKLAVDGKTPEVLRNGKDSPLAAHDDYFIGKHFNSKSGLTVLVGGAGNDSQMLYLPLLQKSLSSAGIGGIKIADSNVSGGIELDAASIIFSNQLHRPSDYARYAGKIKLDIPSGGQLNLIGYSWGAVQASQTAIAMAYSGYKVDNVVLLGAPVNQDLLAGLANHPNIGRVSVINLGEFGDPIYAGMPDYKIVSALPTLVNQMKQGSGHFVYSQQGEVANARRDNLGKILYQIGLR